MTIVLALTIVAVSTSVIAETTPRTERPSRVAIICTKSGDQVSGLTKTCYYNCVGEERAMTTRAYESCPSWTPRWRLNRNSQFGPRKPPR
jgi:hypothetical protein